MGLFNKLWNRVTGSKSVSLENSEYFIDILSSNPISFDLRTKNKILSAYYKTPQLSSIVDYSSKVFARNDLRYYNNQGEQQDDEIIDILNNPHPLYSEGEFWETFAKQFELFNIVYVYKVKGVGMPLKGLFVLPGDLIKITPKKNLKPIDVLLANDLDDIIDYYQLTYNDGHTTKAYKIPSEDVFVISGSSLKFDKHGFLKPDSPIDSLTYPIKNIQANYEARHALITKRGMLGLWVNNNQTDMSVVALSDSEKKEVRKQLDATYGLTNSRDLYGITDANLRFESASIPLKDLELSQAIKDDKIALCDKFNFPLLLLNELEGSTFSNLGTAERLLYTNKIIPFWEMVAKAFTREFLESGYLEFYTNDIEVLKKDDKIQAETNEINTRIIRELNKSVLFNEMTREAAIYTLTGIADVSEEIAEQVINEPKPKPDETV